MNLAENLTEYLKSNPGKNVIAELNPFDGSARSYRYISNADLLGKVRSLAGYLQKIGVSRGDRVAILSNSRPEWLVADLAIQLCGAVSVAIYQTLNTAEIAYILYDSNTKVIFAENQEQIDKLKVIFSSENLIPAVEDKPALNVRIGVTQVISFEDVEGFAGTVKIDNLLNEYEKNFTEVKIIESDLASLVYTSGTTGPAKGVMQTHANHLANISQVVESGIISRNPSIMIVLPLAHSFARLMAYLGIFTGCSLIFPAVSDRRSSKFNASAVTRDIKDANANIIPIVPRILEKMKEAIEVRAAGEGLAPGVLNFALKLAQKKTNNSFKLSEKLLFLLIKPVLSKVKKELFGSQFHFAVSGGAKLYPEVNSFFESLDIQILQGYGLTETCVATNINRPENNRIGTVGPVLSSSIQIRIDSDGEILFRGPNITQGYLNRPKATAESWDREGWFHTGDLGSLDNQQFLTITGRKKELIVNSYGKKIAPADIEAKLIADPLVAQAMIVGNDKKYCAALLTLNLEMVKKLFPGINFDNIDWNKNPELLKYTGELVSKLNSELASYEAIKKFLILKDNWTVENGFLTPTFKAKRSLIERAFTEEINSLYA
jgi:long-chain acyl-CoA synthetase